MILVCNNCKGENISYHAEPSDDILVPFKGNVTTIRGISRPMCDNCGCEVSEYITKIEHRKNKLDKIMDIIKKNL